jgi:proteic killer suppression protein
MIVSFRDAKTERFWLSGKSRRIPVDLRLRALTKLTAVHGATSLLDLTVPPENRLEALRGDRTGQHSIRSNDRYRVCFVWRNGNAGYVEIADYH